MTEKNLTYQVKPCKTYLGIEQKINESENTHAMCFLTALARMRPPNRAGPDHCSPFHGHARPDGCFPDTPRDWHIDLHRGGPDLGSMYTCHMGVV